MPVVDVTSGFYSIINIKAPMGRKLVEIEPGRWRFMRHEPPPARSDLPMPHVIGDVMDLTEQVDGKFYDSKSAFRRVGRQLGLTEVGTEKPKLRTSRASDAKENKKQRRGTLQRVIAEHKEGRRPRITSRD